MKQLGNLSISIEILKGLEYCQIFPRQCVCMCAVALLNCFCLPHMGLGKTAKVWKPFHVIVGSEFHKHGTITENV